MSAATDSLEDKILNLLLNNIPATDIGDAAGLLGSAAGGNLYVALHTADPGEAGSYAAEAAYTSYARVPVARDSGSPKWTVGSGTGVNANAVNFPIPTGGSSAVTHFSIGTASTGGTMLLKAAVSNPTTFSPTSIPPFFAAGQLAVTAA